MNREDLETKARALGVSFNARTSDETLAQRVEEAEAAEATAMEVVDDVADALPARVKVKISVQSVWTDRRKAMFGEIVEVPRAVGELLEAKHQAVML